MNELDTQPGIERRTLAAPSAGVSVRSVAGKPKTIVGYAAVFYDPSKPGTQFELRPGVFERIMPGAFDEALRRDDVRCLLNHDPNWPIGRTAAGTLRLSVDSVGLRFECDLPDSPIGATVAEAVRRGDISGCSFSFKAERDRWTDGARELLSVRLLDAGPVTFPAYTGTTVGTPRSIEQIERDQRNHHVQRVLRDARLSQVLGR